MSTVDTAIRQSVPGDWLDNALERGERTKVSVDWRRVFLAVLLSVPLAVGWAAGTTVRLAVFAWAAAGEGYARGRTATPARDEGPRR